MSEYEYTHRSLLFDDAWAEVAREVSDFATTPDTDKVEPAQIISEVPMPRPIAAQSAADLNIPVEPEEWASEPVDPTRCSQPGCHGWRASGGPLCKVHTLAARFRLPGFGLALVTALLGACGGPAEAPLPAHPCAYTASKPVYCWCARYCAGQAECTLHAGRCDGTEPTECSTADVEIITSTDAYSIQRSALCGPASLPAAQTAVRR
mgnify:CR=1 FL=1